MIRKIIVIILLLSAGYIQLDGQSRTIRQARNHIDAERYLDAIELLQPLFRGESVPDEVYLVAGIAYLNVPGGAETAMELLTTAKQNSPFERRSSQQAIESRFYLGQAYHLLYRFDDAIKIYDYLLENVRSSQSEIIDAINRERNYSINAIELIKNPVNFDITTLGRAINTPFDEHSPVVSLDESSIFFTSNRPQQDMEDQDGRYFEGIYVSYWRNGAWTSAERLELPGLYFGNRATASLSADGQTLIFFQNDGMIGNLYQTRFRFGEWGEPEPFPLPINSQFNETHASLSPDGNTIYFVSDRPGGFGGKDIYISHRLPDGNWGEPINAGPNVNTPYDEESPHIHADGQTLYFSSEGHNSMGGFDIFRSTLNEKGEWGKAENLGYPINTPDDDLFYIPTPDGQRVYYSSRQPDGMGATDIYLISFPADDERSLAVLASHIFTSGDKPAIDCIVRIYDVETNMIQGVYRPNSLSGKFVAVLPAGRRYRLEIALEGFKTHMNEVNIPLRDVYGTRNRAFYVQPITLQKSSEASKE
ncbi:PD40 domain-containing protein [Natronoflexus pectinivorans]|uniref:WD40 repeat protein n=1 Tax=Natronoflexus pectinivorans TaxID=682526 RepID=A0A4R2GFX7_9BACT|nr:PD40 domain-containing protein [Natronoflexus pectinivorans]TCO07081.1 WD40 repeat protein [Natronoflexus pectinivorans]